MKQMCTISAPGALFAALSTSHGNVLWAQTIPVQLWITTSSTTTGVTAGLKQRPDQTASDNVLNVAFKKPDGSLSAYCLERYHPGTALQNMLAFARVPLYAAGNYLYNFSVVGSVCEC